MMIVASNGLKMASNDRDSHPNHFGFKNWVWRFPQPVRVIARFHSPNCHAIIWSKWCPYWMMLRKTLWWIGNTGIDRPPKLAPSIEYQMKRSQIWDHWPRVSRVSIIYEHISGESIMLRYGFSHVSHTKPHLCCKWNHWANCWYCEKTDRQIHIHVALKIEGRFFLPVSRFKGFFANHFVWIWNSWGV